MKHILMTLPLILLAACAVPVVDEADPAMPDASNDACGASQYRGLVSQDATALERQLILGQVRIIRPGTAVTMDFRPERLNFEIDEQNRIARVYCS